MLQAFRKARSGGQLPNPRLISSSIHRQSPADTQQFTMLVMQWGQFIDHDITGLFLRKEQNDFFQNLRMHFLYFISISSLI